mgnify:CR=1 FL=1
MKNILYIVLLALMLAACGEREVDKLLERGGLSYTVNEEAPYTGKLVTYWDDKKTQKKLVTKEKDGKINIDWE